MSPNGRSSWWSLIGYCINCVSSVMWIIGAAGNGSRLSTNTLITMATRMTALAEMLVGIVYVPSIIEQVVYEYDE